MAEGCAFGVELNGSATSVTPQEGLSKEDLRKVPQDGLSKLPSGRSAGNTSRRLQEDSRRKASGRYLRKEGLRKVPQEVLRKVSQECLRKTSTKSKYRRSADYLNETITKTYHLEHLGTMGPIYV